MKNPVLQRLDYICKDIETARVNKLEQHTQPSRHTKNVKIFTNDIAKLLFNRDLSDQSLRALAKNELISKESEVGATVFGRKALSDDNQRTEFFLDGRDEKNVISWFFHEDMGVGSTGNRNSRTLHYEVLPAGVLLVGNNYLNGPELDKFVLATEMYHERVMNQIYSNSDSVSNLNRSNKKVSKIGKVIKLFKNGDSTDHLAA
jgi:hypothetical protein